MLRLSAPTQAQSIRAGVFALGAAAIYVYNSREMWPESWTKGYQLQPEPTVPVWRETRYLGGIAGTTMWENIYIHNGTLHVLSSAGLPEPGYIMCGHPVGDDRPPAGPDRWKVVTRDEARKMGKEAIQLGGVSVLFNDESSPNMVSFLGHYYHYFAEVFLAAWRIISSFYGSEIPTRIMFRVGPDTWKDAAGLVDWLHHALLPQTAIEELPRGTVMFDKLVIVDRFAAHQHGSQNITKWSAMTMQLKALDVPDDWMEPLRDALAVHVHTERRPNPTPVVTYMNRQKTGRRLRERDAELLLADLEKLEAEGSIRLHARFFEDMSPEEQFSLILNTDILLGVHGNGLTHQMWMKPGSAVVEIMGEGGFAIIFPWLASLMGHEHLAVHNDHIFTEDNWTLEDGSALGQDGDFRTDHIRVSAPFVASLIRDLASRHRVDI